jgi:hypothetical protein
MIIVKDRKLIAFVSDLFSSTTKSRGEKSAASAPIDVLRSTSPVRKLQKENRDSVKSALHALA